MGDDTGFNLEGLTGLEAENAIGTQELENAANKFAKIYQGIAINNPNLAPLLFLNAPRDRSRFATDPIIGHSLAEASSLACQAALIDFSQETGTLITEAHDQLKGGCHAAARNPSEAKITLQILEGLTASLTGNPDKLRSLADQEIATLQRRISETKGKEGGLHARIDKITKAMNRDLN